MRNAYQSFLVMMLLAIGVHVSPAQSQPLVRIKKAPVPVVTNNISVEELNRMAAEQNKMLEKQLPWMAMSKTNTNFAQAIGYIRAEMAGHKPENLPTGLTRGDISNAYYHMFIAPQVARAAKPTTSSKPIGLYGKVVAPNITESPSGTIETRSEGIPNEPRAITNRNEVTGNTPEMYSAPASQALQKRLEDMANSRGVSLNVLTQEAAMQWSNALREESQKINRVIKFYGKVVDENGLPIQRAYVEFSTVVFPEEQFQTNLLSDTNGIFALNNVPGAILLVQVSKEAYEEVPGTNQNKFNYYSASGSASSFRPNSNNPVVFHLRKKAN